MQMYTDFHSHKKIILHIAHINKLILFRFKTQTQRIIPVSSRPQLQRYKQCFIMHHMAGVTTVEERTRPGSISMNVHS